jgi:hypothetical protein
LHTCRRIPAAHPDREFLPRASYDLGMRAQVFVASGAEVPVGGARGAIGRPSLAHDQRAAVLLIALPLFLAAACRSGPERGPDTGALPRGPEVVLPEDWRTKSPEAFATWLEAAMPLDRATPIEKYGLRELQAALDQVATPLGGGAFDPLAVRAAVILGRSRSSPAASLLIRRLEKRVLGPERWSDCGDAVAAAALARYPDPRRYAQRLVPLAVGPRPHPDLEVRVECAATALHAGYREVIPFLLQVLRIDTYAGQSDRRDFAVSPTTAWARGRAAEALSACAGVPLTYRSDGPIAHREEEAARLEALLLPGGRAAADALPPGTAVRSP